jgi:glycosyltransferase involved in cell wall biosynthesis
MKIMYLARRPVPSVNANSVQIVTMCEAFAKLGHEVALVAQPGDAAADTLFERYGIQRSFSVRTLPNSGGGTLPKWRYLAELRQLIRSEPADLYFGRDIWSLRLVARSGKPLVYEAHVAPPGPTLRGRLLGQLFAKPDFSHLVCVTTTLADMYRAQFPQLAGKPVIVAPNAAADISEGPAPGSWPGRNGRLQAGFVGRPYPGKGIEMIVEAAGRLPEVDFHVVGAHRSAVGWVRAGIPGNVHFHGYQPHAALGGFYRRFDVALAPYGSQVLNASRQESAAITSPLKLGEYLAAGLPTVVSDLPGVRDMLNNPEAAILIPPGSVEALVEALRRAHDPGLRREVGAAARHEYLKHHTAAARARKVLGRWANDPARLSPRVSECA